MGFRQSLVVRQHSLADKFRPRTFEMQLLRVGSPPLTHTVINIYRPQWMSSITGFADELSDIVAMLSAHCADNIVVIGDLNCPGPRPDQLDVELEAALNRWV